MNELLSSRPGDHRRSSSGISHDETLAADRGINFTMFLTMMSEKLIEFDPEADLVEAFECFDENDTGYVKADEMREWLSTFGERMDSSEVRYAGLVLTCLTRNHRSTNY